VVSTATTGSPTNRTRSVARNGRAVCCGAIGNSTAGERPRSAPVTTSTTPGDSRAADTSIDVIRACAMGDRTNVTCSAPASRSSTRSSVYTAPLVRNSGSSTRGTRVPKILIKRGA
jgi:hypothetical protein